MTQWWILFATSLLMFTLNVDLTATNLALPAITLDLNTNLSTAQWIINGSLIACATLTATAGRLGDLFGHRKIYLLGSMMFLLASFVVGASQNGLSIILGRVFQGFSLALCFPMIYVLNYKVFPKTKHGVALGILTTVVGFAQAIGPSFGGFLIQFLSWRWIFFVNIPIVLLSCWVVWKKYSEDSFQKVKIDYAGIVFLALALFCSIYALNQAHNWGLFSILFISLIVLSFIFFSLFIWVERKSSQPIIDLRLFKNKNFTFINLIRGFYNYCFFVILFFMGLFLQNIVGMSAVKAGFYLLFMTVIFGIVAPFYGKLIDKVGIKTPMIIAVIFYIISFGFFLQLTLPFKFTILIPALFFLGLSCGAIMPTSSVGAMSSLPPEKVGMGTGCFFTTMFVSSSLGVAISGIILSIASKNFLIKAVEGQNLIINQPLFTALKNVAVSIQPVNTLANLQLQNLAKAAFMNGFTINMWVCFGMGVVSLMLSLLLKNPKTPY